MSKQGDLFVELETTSIEEVDLTHQETLADLYPGLPNTPVTPKKRKAEQLSEKGADFRAQSLSPAGTRQSHGHNPGQDVANLLPSANEFANPNTPSLSRVTDQPDLPESSSQNITPSNTPQKRPRLIKFAGPGLTKSAGSRRVSQKISPPKRISSNLASSQSQIPRLADVDHTDSDNDSISLPSDKGEGKLSRDSSSSINQEEEEPVRKPSSRKNRRVPKKSSKGATDKQSEYLSLGRQMDGTDDKHISEDEHAQSQTTKAGPTRLLARKFGQRALDVDDNDTDSRSSDAWDSGSESELPFIQTIEHLSLDERRKVHEEIVSSAKSAYELFIDRSKSIDAGWGLFTRENIPAGADIFVKPIFAHAVDPESRKIICDGCFFVVPEALKAAKHAGSDNPQEEKMETMEVCKGCRSVAYCSKACAAYAWESYHRYECEVAHKFSNYANFPDSWRICVRVLLQKIKRKDFETKWQETQVLEGHTNLEKKDPMLEYSAYLLQRLSCDTLGVHVSCPGIRELIYRIGVNQAGLMVTTGYQAGSILDPLLSMINHDCNPNAYAPFCDGGILRLRTARAIAAGDEVTVSYIGTALDVDERKEKLSGTWHFTCRCKRCLEEHARGYNQDGSGRVDEKTRKDLIELQPWLYGGDKSACQYVETELKRIMTRNEPHYPANVHPVPNINYSMAKLCLREGDYFDGLKFILACVLYEREDVMLHLTSWELLASIWKEAPKGISIKKEKKDESENDDDEDHKSNHVKTLEQTRPKITRSGVRKKKVQRRARRPSPPPSSASSTTDEEQQIEPWILLMTDNVLKKMEARILMKGYFLHWWKLAAKIYGPDSTYLVGWKSRFEDYELWTGLPRDDSETFAKLFYQAQKKLLDMYDIPQDVGIKLEAANM